MLHELGWRHFALLFAPNRRPVSLRFGHRHLI
jgi:hypothetical protein